MEPSLGREWFLAFFTAVVFGISLAMVAPGLNPMLLVAAIAWHAGHMGWITFDRKRRGKEVGPWRFFAFLFGPLALWAYMLLEYRWFGLALIWLSLGLYTLAFGVAVVGARLLPLAFHT